MGTREGLLGACVHHTQISAADQPAQDATDPSQGTDGSNLDVCGVLPAETQTEARKRASASPSPESTA